MTIHHFVFCNLYLLYKIIVYNYCINLLYKIAGLLLISYNFYSEIYSLF